MTDRDPGPDDQPLPGVGVCKPGSALRPLPGIGADVVVSSYSTDVTPLASGPWTMYEWPVTQPMSAAVQKTSRSGGGGATSARSRTTSGRRSGRGSDVSRQVGGVPDALRTRHLPARTE